MSRYMAAVIIHTSFSNRLYDYCKSAIIIESWNSSCLVSLVIEDLCVNLQEVGFLLFCFDGFRYFESDF